METARNREKPLTWAPRILLALFALFLTIFSLDVFEEGRTAGEIAMGLLVHNLPSLLLFVILALSWRREWLGAIACAVLGVFYIAWAWGRFPLIAYVAISGPLFVIAALYTMAWRNRTGNAG